MKARIILLSTVFLALCACSDRADEKPFEQPELTFEEADSFLQFINTQASLGPGKYTLVVATTSNGVSGDYRIEANINGEYQNLEGSWDPSSGLDADPDNNPSHSINLSHAGGISTTTTAEPESYLYLLKNGFIVAEGEEIELPVSQIDSQTYTDAYYRAVDPENERSTLSEWKKVNGFDQGHDVHVIFRDTKDLGYGRNMYARKDPDSGNISFFVQNYAADLGTASGQYSSANLTAATEEMQRYHIGTNAIEFSPINANKPNSEKILKFFTFRREKLVSGATEYRQDTSDLDGRGEKFMPVPCLVCHGARLLPLDENGDFQLISLKSAKLNQLEVDSFEFTEAGLYQQSEMESQIKRINRYVSQTYENQGTGDPTTPNRWNSDFALHLSEGRYGGTGFPLEQYDDSFIPEGWQANASRPDGVEELFREVVQPHCISCHSIRGKTVAEVNNAANDINFSSYEKFMSYNDQIIDYVFVRGIMPLSLLNYQAFWEKPDGAPALLATFLEGFDNYDQNNLPLEPGRPYARPGENRTAWSPVQLNGSASSFAKSYQWQIKSQPAGAEASLSKPEAPNPVFKTDTNGNYTLGLEVKNELGSHTQTMVLTIDDTVTSPLDRHQSELNFAEDVMDDILGATLENNCANCHRSREAHIAAVGGSYSGEYDGIPVFYSYFKDGGAELNTNLYRDVKARVNLADPENSLLLRKPTGNHHGGEVRIDRDTLAGENQYQVLLNWIREGAVCGDPESYEICRYQ